MAKQMALSGKTRRNWAIDAFLLISALCVSLSGVYFLYLPNGYQGGRNPLYDTIILFSRQTWELVHTWTGIAMIAIAMLHIVLHWKWVTTVIKRLWLELTRNYTPLNRYGKFNASINLLIGVCFLIAAVSGIYFLFFPGSGRAADPMILFSRTLWDMLHTWSGIVMILAAIIHFTIHWRWAANVTRRIFILNQNSVQGAAETCTPISDPKVAF
jgi:cytochrome b subunit of formate dehydrogenase